MALDPNEVLLHVRHCFGATCDIESFVQFKGGARKQVFFLQLRNPSVQCVMYLWHNAENYFSERVAGGFEATQTDDKAPDLFLTNTRYLLAQGINVPRVLYAGVVASGHRFAFVEQIIGADFNTFVAALDAAAKHALLLQIRDQLAKLHAQQRDYPGGLLDLPGDQSQTPQDVILARALLEVAATSEVRPAVAEQQTQISAKLRALRAPLAPRSSYHLLHGELAGSHVLVQQSDQAGNEVAAIYFVDIEGIHFADLEFEHTFLQLIYGADYRYLTRTDLDPARMAFYKFAMHVSLVYAGSCFMLRGFHNLPWAESLFKGHLAQILNSL
ncbi:MAG: phosphotransferase [Chloroflexi bacterium]|nr:phosphotransferase [Chloroflexota bacterium]